MRAWVSLETDVVFPCQLHALFACRAVYEMGLLSNMCSCWL